MKSIINIESVSKKYHIGANYVQYKTLRESLASFEFLTKKREFWALKDVSFSMIQGEIMGVIGENGAGKTTLLKILSRITKPTTGRGRINGRVASLLEVGTGFHPELTGRENIYLNGVILGLKKREIDRNFNDIVEFAGAGNFLNTPIKHYSSGMWARLAFSVAAHLEPEILLIDEVLSVGDAEFQKKSLAKMSDLSNSGRTVIFVSHNLAAVRQLCSRCMLLNRGRVAAIGEVDNVIGTYMSDNKAESNGTAYLTSHPMRKGSGKIKFSKIELRNQNNQVTGTFLMKDDLYIHLYFEAFEYLRNVKIMVDILNSYGEIISRIYNSDSGFSLGRIEGYKHVSLRLKDLMFYPGKYYLSVSIISEVLNYKYEGYDEIDNAIAFDIENQILSDRILSRQEGLMLLLPEWQIHNQ